MSNKFTIFEVRDNKVIGAADGEDDATRTDGHPSINGWYFILDIDDTDPNGTGPFLGEEGARMAAEVTFNRLTGSTEP